MGWIPSHGKPSALFASASFAVATLAVWGLILPSTYAQSVTSQATPASVLAPAPGGARHKTLIPAPRQFRPDDPAMLRARQTAAAQPTREQDTMAAQAVPSAVALPVENGAGWADKKDRTPAKPPPPPARIPIDTALVPGRAVEPIDLANVLRLAGARDLDIAIARQRILESAADLKQARALWLPSLFYGPTWYRADGQIQTITGQVETIDRSSLFLGGTAALANAFPAPSPGTGFPSLNGLSATLRISDAIFEPMAARRNPGGEPGGTADGDQRCVAANRRGLL